MRRDNSSLKYIISYIVIGIFAIFCVCRLINLQIVKGNDYREQAESRLVRTYAVKAPRGEFLDRYGRPLISNRMGFYIQCSKTSASNDELNRTILRLINIVSEENGEYIRELPIEGYPYEFNFTDDSSESRDAKIGKWKSENKFDGNASASDVMDELKERYEISDDYTEQEQGDIAAVRYSMEQKSFNANNPYTFASDVSMNVVQKVKEQSNSLVGVNIEVEPIRSYDCGSLAAHILGRTDVIYKEEYEELKEEGYGMNDLIGKDGLEKVLEKYLKGTDGYKSVEQTKRGNVSSVLGSRDAIPGNYAVLTLDKELQKTTEESLAKRLGEARSSLGAEAYSGAAVAIEISSGDILACATYPTYNPEEYTEKYNDLLNDPTKPLFNRALDGIFTPGSTFKPLVATAALEEGVITPETRIYDNGIYMYYAPSYTPTCLAYKSGYSHGNINVSQAIAVSCNYFFYDIGRRTTIETINKYADYFGLGKATGVELHENEGIVAGPEYRKQHNMEWQPGDTIQAAIGQSDNMYTPLQLANYIAAFLNHGTRYKLHFVKEVRDYETGDAVFKNSPLAESETEISDSTFEAVKKGMLGVTEDGTARNVFADFPVEVGGKTGTAEVGTGSDNVLFVGFAPYDNPQIAVAVVLEHGKSSSYASAVARDIFEKYLELDEVEDDVRPFNKLLP